MLSIVVKALLLIVTWMVVLPELTAVTGCVIEPIGVELLCKVTVRVLVLTGPWNVN